MSLLMNSKLEIQNASSKLLCMDNNANSLLLSIETEIPELFHLVSYNETTKQTSIVRRL